MQADLTWQNGTQQQTKFAYMLKNPHIQIAEACISTKFLYCS